MAAKKKPGRKKGVPNASPADIEARLFAMADLGGPRPASLALELPETTLRLLTKTHKARYDELCAERTRAREDETAALAAKTPGYLARAAKRLAEIIDDPRSSPGAIASAADGLVRISNAADNQDRLNRGKPTVIEEKRDETPDAQLVREIAALMRRPKVAAAMKDVAR